MKKLLKIVLSIFMAMALAIQLPVNLVAITNAEDSEVISTTDENESVESTEENVETNDEDGIATISEEDTSTEDVGSITSDDEDYTDDSDELKYTDEDGNIYYYQISDNKITITDCDCDSTYLEIPSKINGYTVTSIGEYAFYSDSLTSVTIPASITSIGDGAFCYCDNLKEIIVSENNSAYSSVDGILFNKDKTTLVCYPSDKEASSYTIPEGVTTISNNAFSYNYNLTELIFPSSMTTINSGILNYCESLKTVEIPASVTYIGDGSWGTFGARDCPYLESINVAENNTAYSSIDGVLFNKDQTILICYPGGKTEKSYTIPTGVTTIREEAFAFSNLTSITIPDTVTTIEDLAFYISDIESFTIPTSVTSIGDMSFYTSNVDFVTLYVYEGSYAHEYVKEHFFAEQYVVLENKDNSTTTPSATVTPTESQTMNSTEDTTTTTNSESTTSTVSNVQTGDESQLVAYALLGGIALLGVYYTRKKKYN